MTRRQDESEMPWNDSRSDADEVARIRATVRQPSEDERQEWRRFYREQYRREQDSLARWDREHPRDPAPPAAADDPTAPNTDLLNALFGVGADDDEA